MNAVNRPYFAAPHKVDEVTISYPPKPRNGLQSEHQTECRKEVDREVLNEDGAGGRGMNESLSISDENHMKCVKEKAVPLSLKTMTSMAAIADARNSSLLDHVDLTTSQTLNGVADHDSSSNGEEEEVFHGNFANLSIDNGD